MKKKLDTYLYFFALQSSLVSFLSLLFLFFFYLTNPQKYIQAIITSNGFNFTIIILFKGPLYHPKGEKNFNKFLGRKNKTKREKNRLINPFYSYETFASVAQSSINKSSLSWFFGVKKIIQSRYFEIWSSEFRFLSVNSVKYYILPVVVNGPKM